MNLLKRMKNLVSRQSKGTREPRNFFKTFFKLSLISLIPGYYFYRKYKYYIENDPKTLRTRITDKYFNNEELLKETYLRKIIEYLLQYNLIPAAMISDESKERLKCEFLNKEYNYPIGLNIGIDCIGNNTKNAFKTISIDYALALFYHNIDKLKASTIKNLGVEVYVSDMTHTIAPYLTEKKLSHLIDSALIFSDSINIDLSRLNDSLILKNNPEKLKIFLEKICSIFNKNLALKACYEYELYNGFNSSEKSVSKIIQPISPILKKGKTHLFLRIRDDTLDDGLKETLQIFLESKVVDAIIVDAVIDKKMDNNFKDSSCEKLLKIRKLIGKEFPIISCGGVLSGEDVFYRMKNGADFVLIDNAFRNRGPYIIEKIVNELSEIMQMNGIKSINEIKRTDFQI